MNGDSLACTYADARLSTILEPTGNAERTAQPEATTQISQSQVMLPGYTFQPVLLDITVARSSPDLTCFMYLNAESLVLMTHRSMALIMPCIQLVVPFMSSP